MIKIKRTDCPPMLARGRDIDNPACHKEVVEKLHIMQHGKCCYCEKEISTSGHGQAVEHYRPIAPDQFPELKNTWKNLLHACSDCNGKKLNNFPIGENNDPLIIDPSLPSVDSEDHFNPEDHIGFDVDDDDDDATFGRAYHKNDSIYGEESIKQIGLDLAFRRYQRTKGYCDLYRAFIEIKRAQNDSTKQQKVRAFEAMLGANNEYASFAREFARFKNLDSRFGVRIPQGAEILA